MNKFLMAASAAALLAGSALALDSGSTEVFANVDQVCTITNQSSQIDLSNTAVDQWVPGTFSYVCNFTGSPTLTFTSLNGGIVNPDNGGESVDYAIYLNETDGGTPAGSLQASDATTGVSYGPDGTNQNISTQVANIDKATTFKVAKRAELNLAGTYTDTLTINIAP